ncbi:MAG: hypothetical protein OEY59_11365 [Deltaproteobacteria bacterium]|nr:hypothetical protein [Deltaproteobacteria bacterium]
MRNINQENSPMEIRILAKTFAKNLRQQGYSQEDLVRAATMILEQAIEEIKEPESNQNPSKLIIATSKPVSKDKKLISLDTIAS